MTCDLESRRRRRVRSDPRLRSHGGQAEAVEAAGALEEPESEEEPPEEPFEPDESEDPDDEESLPEPVEAVLEALLPERESVA